VHAPKIDKNNQMVELEVHPTHKVVHQRVITPVFVDNRSMIMVYYADKANDRYTYLSSSADKDLHDLYKAQMKKDVVANVILTYFEVRPYQTAEGVTGSYIKMIAHMELGGLLPDFVKKSIGEVQC
jgi:hypothetical protein